MRKIQLFQARPAPPYIGAPNSISFSHTCSDGLTLLSGTRGGDALEIRRKSLPRTFERPQSQSRVKERFYEGKELTFSGRVETGFSERLLHILFLKPNKIPVEKMSFS
jgi:hypothetical protein